jgi:hypothetical protein
MTTTNARIWLVGLDGEPPTLHATKTLAREAAHNLVDEWLADDSEETEVAFYVQEAEIEGAIGATLRLVSDNFGKSP